MSLSTAALEEIWDRNFVVVVGLEVSGEVFLNGDNQGAFQMVPDALLNEASKPISIYYHCFRGNDDHGDIFLG